MINTNLKKDVKKEFVKNSFQRNSNENNSKINTSNGFKYSNTGYTNQDDMSNKDEKRVILPVFNKNNIFITEEFLKKTLMLGGIDKNIDSKALNIFQKAFVHKSYYTDTYSSEEDKKKNEKYFGTIDVNINTNEYKDCMPLQNYSNEVIEWLGDGIIQSVSAIYLYGRFKTQQEGFLTKIRSKLVKTESLSKLALALGFDKYIILSNHIEVLCNGRKNSRILEDCFEAFIGCMMNYFGETSEKEGFHTCYTFIVSVIEKYIDIVELIVNDDNFKDQLMRFFQKKYDGKFPIYESKPVIQSIGENGITNKKFNMYVKDIDGNIIGEGIAKSKKEAEQLAAKQALMYFGISN